MDFPWYTRWFGKLLDLIYRIRTKLVGEGK
jgi:hypothetical protein